MSGWTSVSTNWAQILPEEKNSKITGEIMTNVAAIILAAGAGKRMNSSDVNKVSLPIAGKPMIARTVELLREAGIEKILVVVGFAKESVMKALEEYNVGFVEQDEQKGTADAVSRGLPGLSSDASDVLVLQGDDSAFYKPHVIQKLLEAHEKSRSSITFLTIDMENPYGLGRVIRDQEGNVIKIVEEKDASEAQRMITEINPACYLFSVSFLKKYLPMIKKSPVTGEYYLTGLIELAVSHKEPIETVAAGAIQWRGINTHEELLEAERLFQGA